MEVSKKKYVPNSLVRLGIFAQQEEEEYLATLYGLDHTQGNVVGGVTLLQKHTVVG